MLNELLNRYSALEVCRESLEEGKTELIHCYEAGGKVLLCGNGGSHADCDHIAGELMKGFLKARPLSEQTQAEMVKRYSCAKELLDKLQYGLPAISLPSFSALNSAFCNDVDSQLVYAQSLMALAESKDVLIAISTMGNSENVVNAAKVARALGAKVVALTGNDGGALREIADICICVPENETYKIQELHMPVYHYLCAEIEAHFFES